MASSKFPRLPKWWVVFGIVKLGATLEIAPSTVIPDRLFREKMRFSQVPLSKKAILSVGLVFAVIFLMSGKWYKGKVVDQDVISYYSYLPAALIHQDITMAYSLGNDFYADKVWGIIWKDGMGPVQKYTMGLSWLYAPFFLLGHASAGILGYPQDGYSAPYMFWLQLSGLAYLLLGMWWLRKVLLRYHDEQRTGLVLAILALGTNLCYYALGQAAMPHVYLFALVSGLLWQVIRFRETGYGRHGLLIGLLASLICLTRPNHLILWLLPVLYGIGDVREWWRFWKSKWYWLLAWGILQALIVTPQLFYWHLLTDHWIYYSYDKEGFFWGQPLLHKVLFSFRNGWLVYTPLMLLGISGSVVLRKYAREWAIAIPVVLCAGAYVISAWWCWWYGGSFGQRTFIDFYPLLGLSMAGALAWLQARPWKPVLRWAGWSLLGFIIILNLFQSLQFRNGAIHHDAMTARAYFRSFGSYGRPSGFDAYLDPPDYEAARNGAR